jgi:hypothetical protein
MLTAIARARRDRSSSNVPRRFGASGHTIDQDAGYDDRRSAATIATSNHKPDRKKSLA